MRASLFSRQMVVAESVYTAIEKAMMKTPACYTFTETEAKTFIIPAGQNNVVRENAFNGRSVRCVAIAMNTNENFNGSRFSNPFHYQSFGLTRVAIFNQATRLVDIKINPRDQNGHVQLYYNTLKALHFQHDGPDVDLEDYKDHFVMVFDLTSTQQSNNEVYYPELTASQLRIELNFAEPLEKAVEVLVLGEILTTVYIKDNADVVKDG